MDLHDTDINSLVDGLNRQFDEVQTGDKYFYVQKGRFSSYKNIAVFSGKELVDHSKATLAKNYEKATLDDIKHIYDMVSEQISKEIKKVNWSPDKIVVLANQSKLLKEKMQQFLNVNGLVRAIHNNSNPEIENSLKMGASLDYRDEFGRTLLHLAAFDSTSACISYLIGKGMDVNAQDYAGDTPLHIAARLEEGEGHKKVRVLAQARGVQINKPNLNGDTPLHLAVLEKGNQEVVDELIEHGADPEKENSDKEKPEDIAVDKEYISNAVDKKQGKGKAVENIEEEFQEDDEVPPTAKGDFEKIKRDLDI